MLPVLACSSTWLDGSVQAPVMVETDAGKIQGARYKIAKPRDWNKKILLVAPGWRLPDARLIASLNTRDPFELTLLQNGWLVAATSYHRTGLIVEDGIVDLQNLVQRIEDYYGPAEVLVIEGSSMGGAIGVLVAEGYFFPRHLKVGVLAVGVNLEEPGEAGPLPIKNRPVHSLLLMSNRSEWDSPLAYARQARLHGNQPALWYLDRNGHVNVNSAERWNAVEAMDQWLSSGVRPHGAPPYGYDVTVDLSDRPTTVEELPEGYRVKVTRVDPVFGNIDTDMVAQDLEWMKETSPRGFEAKGTAGHFISYGETYSDVGEGAFVAFLNAEGFVQIAKNNGNAAKGLKCQEDDYLDISAYFTVEFFENQTPRCPPGKENRRPRYKTSDQKK